MKIFKMIRGFFFKWGRSSKIVQNMIFSCQTLVPDLEIEFFSTDFIARYKNRLMTQERTSLKKA